MASRIERAVLKGNILDLVQTRSMFTALMASDAPAVNAPLWDAYVASVFSPIHTGLSNTWTTSTIELQYYSLGSWITYGEDALSIGASNTGDPGPNYTAVVLIAKAAGLRHIGRKFFAGIPKALMDGNELGAAFVGAFASALVAYIAPTIVGGDPVMTPGVVDKTGTFHAFVGGVVSSLLGSMRRRKPGLGI